MERVPVIGFVASSGTGKTTLLGRIIALLRERGLRVGVIKQARDDFDVDTPGKDSYELRKAGAERLLLASPRQTTLVIEHPEKGELRLDELLAQFDEDALDLILIEGFSRQPFPKIELVRGGDTLYYPDDPAVIALAVVQPQAGQASVPVLNLDDPLAITDFVLAWSRAWMEAES